MNVTLDATTEQQINREIELGHFAEPSEVIREAMALLDAQSEWLMRNREAIRERLEESHAQAERGETYTPEQVRSMLAQDRLDRAKQIA